MYRGPGNTGRGRYVWTLFDKLESIRRNKKKTPPVAKKQTKKPKEDIHRGHIFSKAYINLVCYKLTWLNINPIRQMIKKTE